MQERAPTHTPWGILLWAFSGARARGGALGSTLLLVWMCEMAIPYLLGQTVDAALGARSLDAITHYGLMMLGVIVVLYIAHVIYLRIEASLVARATLKLRNHIYVQLIGQPLAFFSRHKGGELGHRVMSDGEVLERHGIYLLADVPFAFLTVLGVVTIMLWTNIALGLVVFGILLVAAILAHFVARPLSGIEKSANSLIAAVGGKLQEIVGGIRTVKTFGRERYETDRLDSRGQDLVDAEIKAGRVASKLEPLIELIEQLGLVVVVWYGAYLVFEGNLTPGQLVAFIAYMELMSEPLQRAGRYYRQYQQARGTLGRIADFLGSMSTPAQTAPLPFARLSDLRVEDLHFTYPGAAKAALDGVALQARAGEVIAIVGANGAGKSTLVDTLLGFHTADSGRIFVNGSALPLADTAALRDLAGVVSQDVFLFHDSLADNIRYGRLAASDAEIADAAKRAGLDPLIGRLPQGLATVLGDRGSKLSGGERQRVALARMLVRDPSLVILDEPTAALDGAAMRDTNRIIRDLAAGRITLVIAHRRETVEMADRAVLLDHGRVAAVGTPAELKANSELFRSLFK